MLFGISNTFYLSKQNVTNYKNSYVCIWISTIPKPYVLIGIGPFPNVLLKTDPQTLAMSKNRTSSSDMPYLRLSASASMY